MAAITTAIELELIGRDAGWTAISGDVLSPLSMRYGIRGSGPTDRTASSGQCRFILDNSAANSGGVVGYYSPGHASARPGFTLGIRVRVTLTDPATSVSTVKFVGSITTIVPDAGAYGSRRVQVEASDWMDDAARANTQGITTQINKRSDEVFSTLVANVARAPEATLIATGRDTYAYALDTAQDEKATPILGEIASVVASELGYCYQKGDGTVVFEARFNRLSITDQLILTNDMEQVGVTNDRSDVLTRVQVTTHPRTVDTSNVVLYQLKTVTRVPFGESITLLGPYTDPDARATRVGGTSMVTPVAVTDYLMNSLADGTGDNLTNSFLVSAELGGNSVRFTITNNATVEGFITFLQTRGLGIYDYEKTVAEVSNTALAASYGDSVAIVNMPFQDDPAVGINAARYLLSLYEPATVGIWYLGQSGASELGVTTQLAYFAPVAVGSVRLSPRTSALQTQMIVREVGDRIRVNETVTGLAASFYIQSVDMDVVAPGIPTVTWGLAPAGAQLYWALGQAGYGELGETTWLSYS